MGIGIRDRAFREGPPTLGAARAGAAAAADDRVLGSGILGLLRPGPGSGVDPRQPGPRPRVGPGALAGARNRTGERADLQRAVLAGGTPRPVPTTTQVVRNGLAVRAAAIGGRRPLTFTYGYLGPTGLGAANGSTIASDGPSSAGLPKGCTDCG